MYIAMTFLATTTPIMLIRNVRPMTIITVYKASGRWLPPIST